MAAGRERFILGVFFLSVFCIISWKFSLIGVRDGLKLAGRGLLMLGVVTWFSSCFYPRLKSYLCPVTPPPGTGPAEDPHSRLSQQEKAREEQQHQHSAKSEVYLEAVVKPRQEAVLRKKEKDFYRMTGQSWKLSRGFALGGEEQETHTDGGDETPNQGAARKRKELEVPNPIPVQTQLPKEKRIITLPDEPPEDAPGVVKIALRFPSGRTVRRRFLKTCRSTVLLDWLHKSGYSPTLYALYMPYPRCPLLTRTDLSVEDVGIVTHTALNVEEKDPSSS